MAVSIVIPAYNEADGIEEVIAGIRRRLDDDDTAYEIIVVDDGSSDNTSRLAQRAGARLLTNPTNKGYGYSLLRGIEAALHEVVVICDADGTYPVDAIPILVSKAATYDMVIGRRSGAHYRGGLIKQFSRLMFRLLVEFTTGSRIPDINSGLRAFRRSLALHHRHAISTGYSFTTTLTLIALLEGHHLCYIDIPYFARAGKSKVRWCRDTLRSLQVIVEVILLYNPLKLYLLLMFKAVGFGVIHALLLLAFRWEAPAFTAVFAGLYVALLLFGVGGIAFISAAGQRRRAN